MSIRDRIRRLPQESYRGRRTVAYTFCIERRVPVFTNPVLVRALESILVDVIPQSGCRSPIYCFMPDHIHLMVQGMRDDANLLIPAQRFKTRAGIVLHMLKVQGRFQRRFYDHVVRSPKDWRGQARYIALNPVRGGLVENYLDFAFTGVIGSDREAMLREIFWD